MNCQSIVLAVPELFGLDRYERRVTSGRHQAIETLGALRDPRCLAR